MVMGWEFLFSERVAGCELVAPSHLLSGFHGQRVLLRGLILALTMNRTTGWNVQDNVNAADSRFVRLSGQAEPSATTVG